MTERSFRDPSPNRGDSTRYDDSAPPVPALPKHIPAVSQKSVRRASSLEPPLRVSSPPPKKPNGRGVSLDRGPGSPPLSNPRQRIPKLSSVQELQRTDSSGSINFSYPTNARNTPPTSPGEEPRVASPPAGARRPGLPLATTPRPSNTLNNGELSNIQYSVQDAANRPVKKKKRVVPKGAAEGSHLAGGISGGRPTGSAVNGGDVPPRTQARSPIPTQTASTRIASPEPSTGAPKPKMKKKVKAAPSSGADQAKVGEPAVSYGSDVDSGAESVNDAPDASKNFNTRAAGMLAKQPSIVREDRELEEAAEQGGRAAPLPQLQTGVAQGRKVPAAQSSKKNLEDKPHSRSASQPVSTLTPTSSTPSGAVQSGAKLGAGPGKSSLRGERHQSLSPSRSARFSTKPTVFDSLNAARHEPPPRSFSPAKSALKQSPSPRRRSPVDPKATGVGRVYGKTPSEASDNTSLLSEEGAMSGSRKKKQARVSFDEETVIVSAAVSPPTSPDTPVVTSAQNQETTKRGWFSRGKKDKKEQDDVMKPTPALPSFGSVRREEGVSNRAQEPEASESIPVPISSSARAIVDRINMSSDSAVGGILSQDFASKNSTGQQEVEEPARNDSISQQSQTSAPQAAYVEGTGYASETDGSVYSTDGKGNKGIQQANSVTDSEDPLETYRSYHALASPPPDQDDESHQLGPGQRNEDVPSFNLIQATPNLQETENRQQWPGLPGISDRSVDEEADQVVNRSSKVEHHPTDPTPASLGIAEPEPEEAAANHTPGSPVVGEMAEGLRLQTEPHDGDESDDTGNSIYSDAAEDLSDLEGDGFGSINAIVESPAVNPSLAITTPPDSPISKVPKVAARPKNQLARQESDIPEPSAEEGWEKAQEYWSKLSDRRKKQMELDAVSAEDEAVAEPVQPKPKKRVVKKKATEPAGPTQQQTADDAPLPPWPDQQYLSSATKSKKQGSGGLKSSMRAEPTAKPTNSGGLQQSKWAEPKSIAGQPGMKKSMRSDGDMRSGGRGPPPSSARQSELQPAPRPRPPQGALQKKTRPASAAAVVDYSKIPTSPPKHSRDFSGSSAASSVIPAPPRTTKKKTVTPTPLNRTLSNDSDSASSFRKQKRPASGAFTMRSTMRGAHDPMPAREARPTSPDNVGTRSSRFSIRSLSPTGTASRKPFNPPAAGAMRSSMRGSMDAPAPSLRKESKGRAKSPSRFSFGGKPKAKAAPAAPKSGGFRSRFADSSDEDEYPTTFRSRYDSSDDDEPASPAPRNLAPVRGIPRRIGEADKESTDLSDSEEETISPPSKKAAAILGNRTPVAPSSPTTVTHEGSALATGSLRRDDLNMAGGLKAKKAAEKEKEKKEKKRSFFGGRSKKKEESTIADPPQPASPIARPRQPSANGPSAPPPPSRGKLQRRNTPKSLSMAQNEEWPLPPPIPGINGARPSTADGAPSASPNFRSSMRPDIGNRRSTTPAPPAEENNVGGKAAAAPTAAGDAAGKKKRFGGLRKVFGMKSH